jgi:hypothetical protein
MVHLHILILGTAHMHSPAPAHVQLTLNIQRLNQRVVPVGILAIHAACCWTRRAVGGAAHPVKKVSLVPAGIEPQFGSCSGATSCIIGAKCNSSI